MKQKLLFLLVLLLTATTGAWAQEPVDGTIAWSVGNEANATVSASIKDAISSTGVTTGSGLTVSTGRYFNTNMVKYQPATANAGNVEGVMIEYTIEAVDGYKFKPTGVDYAAVQEGTDNASYSWSYTIDGAESAITDVSKTSVLRNNGSNSATAQLMHSESITADGCSVFTLRFYISNCGNTKKIAIANITISGSVSAAAASGYTVSLKDGVKDAGKWTVKAGTDGSFQSLPLKGVKAGTKVKLKYDGDRSMLKGVTAVKKAVAPGAVENAYLKWDADQKKLVATPMPESFTTVTSENTQWSAGTYVVEGQVEINRTIELSGDVNLIIKDGAKLTVDHLYGNSHNLSIYGQAQMTGELDVSCSGGDAINEIPTLEVHSAKVTATSSESYGAGFGAIGTFNVYGGLVDAKGTAAEGGCGICLSEEGSMNIYGGEVKAEGKGIDSDSYGITCIESLATTVKVYGGKLWAGCADNSALVRRGINLTKNGGFNGKIETSNDDKSWEEYDREIFTSETKYVRVGY